MKYLSKIQYGMSPIKAYIVCRQSKQSQSVRFDGLERQQFMCADFCANNHMDVSHTLSKIASGWKGKYLKDLYAFISAMTDGSALVTYRVDRFCRNKIMGKQLIELMREKKIIVHSLYDGVGASRLSFDFNNFIDCALFEQLIEKAEKESLTISNRQKLAASHKKHMADMAVSEIKTFIHNLALKNMTIDDITQYLNSPEVNYKNTLWTTDIIFGFLNKNTSIRNVNTKKRKLDE